MSIGTLQDKKKPNFTRRFKNRGKVHQKLFSINQFFVILLPEQYFTTFSSDLKSPTLPKIIYCTPAATFYNQLHIGTRLVFNPLTHGIGQNCPSKV